MSGVTVQEAEFPFRHGDREIPDASSPADKEVIIGNSTDITSVDIKA